MSAWISVEGKSAVCGWTGKLPNDLYGVWVKMLLIIKEYGWGGKVKTADMRDLLPKYGATWEDASNVMTVSKGRIYDRDGETVVAHWNDYQRDPTNADRQARYKDRHPKVTLGNEGNESNADRTVPYRTGQDIQDIQDNPTIIPNELTKLNLYSTDGELLKAWPELLPSWKTAHPNLDIGHEIARAHAWEVARPKERKKDRPKFLTNWLNNTKAEPLRVKDRSDRKFIRDPVSGKMVYEDGLP